MSSPTQHYTNSTEREKLIEHLFISDILKIAWLGEGSFVYEISKPEVDGYGYDLIIEKGDLIRHVQLKTKIISGKTANWKAHISLAKKRSGCIIVIMFDEQLKLGPFLFCGGSCSEGIQLSEKIATHTKHNKEGIRGLRDNIRVMSKSAFREIATLDELLKVMFS